MNDKTELASRRSDGNTGVIAIPFKVDFNNNNLLTGVKLVVFSNIEHGQHLVWVSRSFKKEDLKDGMNYLQLRIPLLISEGPYETLTKYI